MDVDLAISRFTVKLAAMKLRTSESQQLKHTKHTTTVRSPSSEPLLFALSAELRNEIYRLALPVGQRFEIFSRFSIPEEPGLLRVNCKVRNEAILLYYQENEWVFPMTNMDAHTYIKWSHSSPWRIAANIRWTYPGLNRRSPTANFHGLWWMNLCKWLEAYSRGVCLRIEQSQLGDFKDPEHAYLTTAAHLFEMVHKLREDHALHWPEIESLLENAHGALVAAIKPCGLKDVW